MTKMKELIFVCNNCGNEFTKWAGQCLDCGEWNSLREVKNLKMVGGGGKKRVKRSEIKVINLGSVGRNSKKVNQVFSTEISEFDRVLGKGIVRGSVMLFSGEPGVGKSTLLTQVLGRVGGLYVTGEESLEQVRLRVKRLGLDEKNFDILVSNSLHEVEEVVGKAKDIYKIVVIDSIQVLMSDETGGVPGSMSQLRDCTFKLVGLAKKTGSAIFIVGHVTKEGNIAGPKLLEHMVDVVLHFEGEKSGELRILRTIKNRFGSSEEVGVFKMGEKGLRQVRSDEINLVNGVEVVAGRTVTVVMEGSRPMIVEIQALVTESFAPMPKRGFVGIDYNRGQILVAVAQKCLGLPLYKNDVFVSVMGGIKVADTGVDLAVIGAIYTSYKNKVLPAKSVLVGEVSLVGEVRKVRLMDRRMKEISGLGRKMFKIKNIKELRRI